MPRPHEIDWRTPIRENAPQFGVGLLVTALSGYYGAIQGGVYYAVIVALIVGIVINSVLWWTMARQYVRPALVLRTTKGEGYAWVWEWWRRSDCAELPEAAKIRYGADLLPVVDALDTQAPLAFNPYRTTPPPVSSQAVGAAFDQTNTLAVIRSGKRLSSREKFQIAAMTGIFLGSMAINALVFIAGD